MSRFFGYHGDGSSSEADLDELAALEILARVRSRHPADRNAQRRMLARWSSLIAANDPGIADALLDVRLDGRRAA